VFNGNVTLLGMIPNKEAEERLLKLVWSVKGVKLVTSKLMIQQK
jgi:osmotically-inducible protein OsmY